MPSHTHQLLTLLLTVLTIQCWCIGHTTNAQRDNGSAEHSLVKKLINNYPETGQFVVPRREVEPVHVNVSIYIKRIMAVDSDKNSVTFHTWNAMEWRDDFLTWDPDEFQGLTTIMAPIETFWTPDIAILAVMSEKCSRAEKANVSEDGTVQSSPSCMNEIRCDIDVTYFPFDHQRCWYLMSSLYYYADKVFIADFKINHEKTSFEWQIDKITMTKEDESYQLVIIDFWIHHKAPLFAFLLILPAALLSILTSVVFLLPSSNENKIEIGLMIFISFMVLLNILMDATPGSSSGMPIIGYYFTVNSFLIAMSVICSTIVIRIYGESITYKNMSPGLKKVTLFMAKILRMKTERRPTDSKALQELNASVEMVDTPPEKCPIYNDWVLLASVLDRFFFLIYLVINVTATIAICIKFRGDTH